MNYVTRISIKRKTQKLDSKVQGELRGAESALSIIICSFKYFYKAKGPAALLQFKTAE